jgi:glycosyltransferase involved in cell wall biosynthesis
VKILQLSNKLPYPPLDGGSIVINNASNGLLALGCEVYLLAVNTPKRPINAADLPKEYRDKVHLQLVDIDTRIKIWDAFLNLFSELPYHVSRYQSADLEAKLTQLLLENDFDIVQIEGLYLMFCLPIIRKYSKAKVVLRSQNVEHQIWEKYTANLPFSSQKAYLMLQTKRLKAFEMKYCGLVDGVIAITEQDKLVLEGYCQAFLLDSNGNTDDADLADKGGFFKGKANLLDSNGNTDDADLADLGGFFKEKANLLDSNWNADDADLADKDGFRREKTFFEKMSFLGKPVIAIPLGIDLEKFRVSPEAEVERSRNLNDRISTSLNDRSIFHLGSMDWYPNLEAIEWFLKEIWPLVHQKMPDLKFYLAGKNMPEILFNQQHLNIYTEDQIDNPVAYMRDKGAMVVPLRSGSGIRVKILEGMAMGKVVISTSIGAEGINYTDGQNILIADTPEALANAILKYAENKHNFEILGQNAQKLMAEQYDLKVLAQQFIEFYQFISQKSFNYARN